MKRSKRHNKKVNKKDLMASQCFIAKQNRNNYESIFCADGHPEYTGSTLSHHYRDHSKIHNLIQEGDISNLGNDIPQCKFYDDDFGFTRPFDNMDSMVEFYRQCGCSYGYIYSNEWYAIHITPNGTSPVNLNLLTNA